MITTNYFFFFHIGNDFWHQAGTYGQRRADTQPMTIRHLKIFIAVAETGLMSAAANRLYVTQPPVAAAKLKRCDRSAVVKIFTKGKDISYAGCGLPYYVGGAIPERVSGNIISCLNRIIWGSHNKYPWQVQTWQRGNHRRSAYCHNTGVIFIDFFCSCPNFDNAKLLAL